MSSQDLGGAAVHWHSRTLVDELVDFLCGSLGPGVSQDLCQSHQDFRVQIKMEASKRGLIDGRRLWKSYTYSFIS